MRDGLRRLLVAARLGALGVAAMLALASGPIEVLGRRW
jgi:hypothetical protein